MKKRKLLALLGSISLVLILVGLSFMTACAKPAPTPAPTPTPAPAPPSEPIVLKAVNFLPSHIGAIRYTKVFADRVNERAKGELTIDLLGGPEVIPPPGQPKALSTGVIDILGGVPHIFEATMPAGHSFIVSDYTPMEERKNGYHDWMNQRFQEKMNMRYMGRLNGNMPFFIFTNFPVETTKDLVGRKIAQTEMAREFLEALDMVSVNMSTSERYPAMEKGMVDSFILSSNGTVHSDIHKLAKYVIDHELYTAASIILMVNLDTWNSLPKHLQDLMNEVMIEMEPDMLAYFGESHVKLWKEILDAGVKAVKLSPEDAKGYTELANQAYWDKMEKQLSAGDYAQLRKFLVK